MWISEDVRYAVIYAVMERFDLNPAVPSATAAINLSTRTDGFLLPTQSFMYGNGRGLEAMKAVRDWDSLEWQSRIEHWYAEGLKHND